ncbi:MAG: ribokinase [Lentisphaerae bacterium]|nr:ribokinase [Lentisphaerota bacterium]
MRILNIGSLNIDYVYSVPHFVRPGETIAASNRDVFAGGKGLNQSIALARADAHVSHAGMVGQDGQHLVDLLKAEGVDVSNITQTADLNTGHAIIQIIPSGENAIVIYAGANGSVTPETIEKALASFNPGEWLLVQNEIASVDSAIRSAHKKGMKVAFNPAPMSDEVKNFPLKEVDLLILNRTEATELAEESEINGLLTKLKNSLPETDVVLTLGSEGAVFLTGTEIFRHPGFVVNALDTTGAGDTFTGFFIAELMRSNCPEKALSLAYRAAAICFSRAGAVSSIPSLAEVLTFGQAPDC